MSESEKKKRKLIMFAIIVALIAGLIALVIFLLTYKKETHIYKTVEDYEVSSLVCTSDTTSESAFFQNNADSVKHEIKVVYKNGTIDQMFYEYRGKYGSWKAADSDEGIMHANYNYYMGDHNIQSSILTPIFQNVDGELKISLYLDSYGRMNSVLSKFFYIGSASIDTIAKNSAEQTKKFYENKGFSCIIGD